MTALSRLASIIEDDGYRVELDTGESGYGPLLVNFTPEAKGGEMRLLIDQVGPVSDEDTSVLVFSLVLPYYVLSVDALPEVIRGIFVMSRLLPLGSYGYCEFTNAVTYKYQLLVRDPHTVDAQVIRDTVGMIGMFTHQHAPLFDALIDRQMSAEGVIEYLVEQGFVLEPIMGSAFNS